MNWPSLTYVAPSRSNSLRSVRGASSGGSAASHAAKASASASVAPDGAAVAAAPAREAAATSARSGGGGGRSRASSSAVSSSARCAVSVRCTAARAPVARASSSPRARASARRPRARRAVATARAGATPRRAEGPPRLPAALMIQAGAARRRAAPATKPTASRGAITASIITEARIGHAAGRGKRARAWVRRKICPVAARRLRTDLGVGVTSRWVDGSRVTASHRVCLLADLQATRSTHAKPRRRTGGDGAEHFG